MVIRSIFTSMNILLYILYKTSSDTWKVQLVCKKIQAHSSIESPLEYNQDQTPLTNPNCETYKNNEVSD